MVTAGMIPHSSPGVCDVDGPGDPDGWLLVLWRLDMNFPCCNVVICMHTWIIIAQLQYATIVSISVIWGYISIYVCIYKYIYTVLYVDYSYNPFTKWDAPASYSWWDVPVPPSAISTHEKNNE